MSVKELVASIFLFVISYSYMKKLSLAFLAFLQALGVTAYISLVAVFMTHAESWVGSINQAVAPVLFLTVFVLSASVTGALVLGKPIILFLENKKTDAIKLFIYTLAWLFAFVVIAILIGAQGASSGKG